MTKSQMRVTAFWATRPAADAGMKVAKWVRTYPFRSAGRNVRNGALIAASSGEGLLSQRTAVARPWMRERVFVPPEPTFAISIEGRLESARHGILWVGFTSSRPSRSGARLFARVGYPAEL